MSHVALGRQRNQCQKTTKRVIIRRINTAGNAAPKKQKFHAIVGRW